MYVCGRHHMESLDIDKKQALECKHMLKVLCLISFQPKTGFYNIDGADIAKWREQCLP